MPKYSTAEVIKCCAYITEKYGYIKRSDDPRVECTADMVIDLLLGDGIDNKELERTIDRVTSWGEYINSITYDSEYISNLRAEIAKPVVDETKVGLIASSFASYDKYKSSPSYNDKLSNFLGEEGDTITFGISEYRLIKSGNSKYGNKSKWYLYKIYDDNRNVIVWFADHDCTSEFNTYNKAVATISKLSTFNEVKQTNVSKLRFL
jgi:hypothetical protein